MLRATGSRGGTGGHTCSTACRGQFCQVAFRLFFEVYYASDATMVSGKFNNKRTPENSKQDTTTLYGTTDCTSTFFVGESAPVPRPYSQDREVS